MDIDVSGWKRLRGAVTAQGIRTVTGDMIRLISPGGDILDWGRVDFTPINRGNPWNNGRRLNLDAPVFVWRGKAYRADTAYLEYAPSWYRQLPVLNVKGYY